MNAQNWRHNALSHARSAYYDLKVAIASADRPALQRAVESSEPEEQ